jgi:protein-tyrosine phosphatase
MCKQGLNRRGLVLGRVLRALGLSGEEAIRTLRAQRPGALANLAFEQLLHG